MSNFLVRKVAVLGAGVMGAQIAAHCVNAKVPVLLFDLPDTKSGNKNGIVLRAIDNLKKLSPAPLANRFLHLQVEPDFESFKNYALATDVHEHIIAFISFRPELLHKLDPQQPAWPSPRSWVMASQLHKAGLNVASAIGAAAATEFHAYAALYHSIPDLERILCGKGDGVPFPSEPSMRYATVVGLITRLNYGFAIGNFELSLEDGEARFRTSIDVEGAELQPALIRQLVRANISTFGRYVGALEQVAAGAEPGAALEEACRPRS